MKTRYALLAALFALSTGPAAQAYDSLEALMLDMNRQQVEAIRAYLDANPEADDAAEAQERLIYGMVSIEDYDGALSLLESRYRALPEDKSDLDLSVAFGEIVVPMVQLYQMAGRKDDGIAFVAGVREAFASHSMAETINEALDEFVTGFDAPATGDRMEIAFTAIDGREVDLAAMEGKVVLVDFWATWCVPCLRTMPGLKKVYDEFNEKGFEIIGISLDSERGKLEEYVAKEGIAWPQYFDGLGWDNELAGRYGIESIPATFLIGPDGTIVGTNLSETQLRAQVAALLGGGDDMPVTE
jgi:thiol-disulfide isomerase/thioredoxin